MSELKKRKLCDDPPVIIPCSTFEEFVARDTQNKDDVENVVALITENGVIPEIFKNSTSILFYHLFEIKYAQLKKIYEKLPDDWKVIEVIMNKDLCRCSRAGNFFALKISKGYSTVVNPIPDFQSRTEMLTFIMDNVSGLIDGTTYDGDSINRISIDITDQCDISKLLSIIRRTNWNLDVRFSGNGARVVLNEVLFSKRVKKTTPKIGAQKLIHGKDKEHTN